MTATNEEMEIEATAEKAGFSIEEPITSNTIAVNVSADTYERLISCAEVEETLDKTINRIMDEIENYCRHNKTKDKSRRK